MRDSDGTCLCGCGGKTRIAPRSQSRYGWVKGEPQPYLRGHAAWKNRGPRWIESPSGCHIWQRTFNAQGYGIGSFVSGGGKKTQLAHRYFYEREFGPVPTGLELDHTCRVAACVNPLHLEPVTQLENIHRKPTTKMREADVAEAYAMRLEGNSWSAIGRRYDISRTRVLTRVRVYCERNGLPYR